MLALIYWHYPAASHRSLPHQLQSSGANLVWAYYRNIGSRNQQLSVEDVYVDSMKPLLNPYFERNKISSANFGLVNECRLPRYCRKR